jgi:hypothetical protein
VIGISWGDDPIECERLVAKQHLIFPTFLEGNRRIGVSDGTSLIPETYLISREGHTFPFRSRIQ